MRRAVIGASFIAVLMCAGTCNAIELKLRRDFGTSMGGKIKGTFSASVKADGAEKVEFYLDGDLQLAPAEPPFRWTFKTADYPDGVHIIEAIAYFPDRTERASLSAHFVTSFGAAGTMLWTLLIGSIAGTILLTLYLAKRERSRPQGRTRCPRCSTVFDRQWTAMHMGNAYRNTCPTCAHTFWAKPLKE